MISFHAQVAAAHHGWGNCRSNLLIFFCLESVDVPPSTYRILQSNDAYKTAFAVPLFEFMSKVHSSWRGKKWMVGCLDAG